MAKLHIITGKGVVGKSTVAATLARQFLKKGEGPILVIDIQGSGRVLEMLGDHDSLNFENHVIDSNSQLFGAQILPKTAFKQYFGILLALGNEYSSLANITSGIRNKVVDLVMDNKIVSAFVDVCPGLEPAVLLGKIHWESMDGKDSITHRKWRHVIVDAPSTGHSLMLFKSTMALAEVFGAGTVFKQAQQIMKDLRNPDHCQILVVGLPEELPIQESLDLIKELKKIGLSVKNLLLNRTPPGKSRLDVNQIRALNLEDAQLTHELEFEAEDSHEKWDRVQELKKTLESANDPVHLHVLPELIDPEDPVELDRLLATGMPL